MLALLLVLTAIPEPNVVALLSDLKAVGPEVSVTRDGVTIRLSREVRVLPANAPSAASLETHTFIVTLTLSEFLDEKAQQALVKKTASAERTAWKTVAALECDGMEFTDKYMDGLCFRAKSAAQEKRVVQYRATREKWLAVPRFHRAGAFSVALRAQRPELISGCAECNALEAKVKALLNAYPEPP
ncbi:MAG: hypothetical protein JNM17_26425 [Archangium sp.]|nr:hypothetical protein [Archangium sp.]